MLTVRLFIATLFVICITGNVPLAALRYEISYDESNNSITIYSYNDDATMSDDVVQTMSLSVTKYLTVGTITYDAQTHNFRLGTTYETPLVQCSHMLKELKQELEDYEATHFSSGISTE